ncbi:MAG: nicotinate phosphoribosyltransferase [Candidatus Omnitrophota bacterium]
MGQSALLLDFYALTMSNAYFNFKPEAKATFDLVIRELPQNRSFFIACGVDEAISSLKNFSFSKDDITYLKKFNFNNKFLNYLKKFKFSGDIWAVKEGTFIFPQEPILRITASLIEAQLVEAYLLNAINVQSVIASKAIRIIMAACKKPVFDFSLRRTQGVDAGLKSARASYIAGAYGTSNALAGKLYGIKVAGTMAHSYVMAFDNELESFRAYTDTFPHQSILLIDTYNYKQGVKNAISVAKQLKKNGVKLVGVRLDSGNLIKESKKIRRIFDKSGLSFVKIFASGNLDEYKIDKIVKAQAPVDFFGVGTNMGVSADAPYSEVIYKICEVAGQGSDFSPTMKLSQNKITCPGRKQVFRIKNKKGQFVQDLLALEGEKIKAAPILFKAMQKGKFLRITENIERVRIFVRQQLKELPDCYKSLTKKVKYPVKESNQLNLLKQKMLKKLNEANTN